MRVSRLDLPRAFPQKSQTLALSSTLRHQKNIGEPPLHWALPCFCRFLPGIKQHLAARAPGTAVLSPVFGRQAPGGIAEIPSVQHLASLASLARLTKVVLAAHLRADLLQHLQQVPGALGVGRASYHDTSLFCIYVYIYTYVCTPLLLAWIFRL